MKKAKSKKTKGSKKAGAKQKRKGALKKKAIPKAKKKTVKTKKPGSGNLPRRASATKPPVSKASPILGDLVGRVTHYFPHVNAAVVKIKKGALQIGDRLHFKGHTTDFQEILQSMQLDHAPIQSGQKGSEVGIGVSQRVREGDSVFKIKTA